MIRATAGTWVNYGTTFVFQVLFARHFGTDSDATAFMLAFALAVAISGVGVSTMQSVLLPRLVGGSETLSLAALRSLGLVWIAGGLVFGLFAAASPMLASSLSGDVGVQQSDLRALMLLAAGFGVLQLLAGGFSAISLALGRRFVPAAAPALPSLIAAGGFLVAPEIGSRNVFELLVLGSVAQAAVVALSIGRRRIGRGADSATRTTLALTAAQFALLTVAVPVEILVATLESPASGAQYSYAIRSLAVAQQLVIGGAVLALLADWSAGSARGSRRALGETLAATVLLLAVVVATVLVAGERIVGLVFEGGEFTKHDTHAVAHLLTIGMLGFFTESAAVVVTQAVLAERRNYLALRVGLARIVLRLILVAVLFITLGVSGVMLAFSLSAAAMLLILLRLVGPLGLITHEEIRAAAPLLAATAAILVAGGILATVGSAFPLALRCAALAAVVATVTTAAIHRRRPLRGATS